MKHFLIIFFLIIFTLNKAQIFLPYSSNNVCLDRTVAISPGTTYPAKNMVVRDFNMDGFDDVLLVDSAQQKVIIYRNTTTNSFIQVNIAVASLSKLNSADAGDFDGDGLLDVVICFGDSLKIYKNNGNFNFTVAKGLNYDPLQFYRNIPTYIKAGKLNADAFDDIAMLTAKTGSFGLAVFAFRNTFTVTSSVDFVRDFSITVPTGTNIFNPSDSVNISIGNYDDIVPVTNEIVISDKRITNVLPVLKNTTIGAGALSFTLININTAAIVPLASPSVNVIQVECDDINNDGKTDVLALTRAFAPSTTFIGIAFFNGSTASLASYTMPNILNSQLIAVAATPSSQPFVPLSFKMGDINGDGFKDIIGMNSDFLLIYLYHPPPFFGTFSHTTPFDATEPIVINITHPINLSAEEMTVGRFDNNGLIDIFYKSWRKNSGGIAGVIPNYSYSVTTNKSDSTVCTGKTVSLSINITPTIGIPPHSVDWHKFPVGLQGTTPVFTASMQGIYYPVLKFPFPGGIGTCSIVAKRFLDTIKVIPDPIITVSDPTPYVCFGKTVSINASIQGTSAATYEWTSNGNIVSNTATLNTSAITTLTFYDVRVFDTKTKCTSSLTVPIDIHPINTNTISASSNKICLGDSVKLSFSGATSYTWSNVTANINDSIIVVKPIADATYSLIIIDGDGCTYDKTTGILIDKECAIKIYNTVSPNGDNINDIWFIENINRFPKNHVTIFNRWGQNVYFTENYNNENNSWPAKVGNSTSDTGLIASTYYFVLNLGNGSKEIKGWIELIK